MKLLLFFAVGLIACTSGTTNNTFQKNNNEQFAAKTIEIVEVLSTNYYPKEDITYRVYIAENGEATARFKLIGETKKTIALGAFAKKKIHQRDGTNCDGKWSCGKAISACLDDGDDALISHGACEDQKYCVTCVSSD